MPEARQNNSKLAAIFERASSFSALVGMVVDVVAWFMALLSFVESAPRAYWLKAGNAAFSYFNIERDNSQNRTAKLLLVSVGVVLNKYATNVVLGVIFDVMEKFGYAHSHVGERSLGNR